MHKGFEVDIKLLLIVVLSVIAIAMLVYFIASHTPSVGGMVKVEVS